MASAHLLRKAAQEGDQGAVRRRLEAGDDREGRHRGTGRTPLLEAATAGHADVVAALLVAGADVTAADTAMGHTALGWAALQGDRAVLTVVLDHGVGVDVVPAESFLGYTPLMNAAKAGHADLVTMLLEAGASLEAVDNRGRNALVLAQESGQDGVVGLLRAAGAVEPAAAPEVGVLPWPDLGFDPAAAVAAGLPAEVTAAEVVRGYVLAMYAWEVAAWAQLDAAREAGVEPEFEALLEPAAAIRETYCTPKRRVYPRGSISGMPALTPEIGLVGEECPTAWRRELLLRYREPEGFVQECEWLSVCRRTRAGWRIDSAGSSARILGRP